MRTPLIYQFIGLGAFSAIVLLNTGDVSVARFHDLTSADFHYQTQDTSVMTDVSSVTGITSASLLTTEWNDERTETVQQDISAEEDAKNIDHAASYRQRLIQAQYVNMKKRTVAAPTLPERSAAPKKRHAALLPAIAAAEADDAHKAIANDVLMHLPEKCRNTLQNFYVRKTKQKNRGLAGRTVMILDGTVPLKEFLALFVHESGHNFDLGCLRGSDTSGKSSFSDGDEAIYKNDPSVDFYKISWITSTVQRSNSTPDDFVSGYAAYAVFEDFAETFAYFYLHNDEFAKRAQDNNALAKKYAFMRDIIFNGTVPAVASSKEVFTGRIPWDITKLDYEWHPELAVAQR